jgi:hypothetical protein
MKIANPPFPPPLAKGGWGEVNTIFQLIPLTKIQEVKKAFWLFGHWVLKFLIYDWTGSR